MIGMHFFIDIRYEKIFSRYFQFPPFRTIRFRTEQTAYHGRSGCETKNQSGTCTAQPTDVG
jgi:hypothetical protein